MNDFQGLLSGDYGFKPLGKSAPIAPLSSNHKTFNSPLDFDLAGSSSTAHNQAPSYSSKSSTSSVFLDDPDDFLFGRSNPPSSQKNHDFGKSGGLADVFGASSKSQADSSANLDSDFSVLADSESRLSSMPVFDKPAYDDDVLDGFPAPKNSSSAKYEDVFSSSSSKTHDAFDDILGVFSRNEPESKGLGVSGRKNENNVTSFDDLLPGFGASTASSDRNSAESRWDKRSSTNGITKATSGLENPFGGLSPNSSDALSSQGLYTDPFKQFAEPGGSSRKKTENVLVSEGLFDDIDPAAGFGKSVPMNESKKVGSPAITGTTMSSEQTSASVELGDRSASVKSPPSSFGNAVAAEDYYESLGFKTFSAPEESRSSALNTSSFSFVNASDEAAYKRHTSTVYESKLDSSDDLWLTVSEIPLLTQPTAAPPPSRPPPPKPPRVSNVGSGPYPPSHGTNEINDHLSFPTSAQFFQSLKSDPVGGKSSLTSPIDELEDFAKGRSWNDSDGIYDVQSSDELDRHSEAAASAAAASAAAMKEAMERAEARFKHAKEARERENEKAAGIQQEKEDFQERESRVIQERLERQRQQRVEEERKKSEEEEKLQGEKEEREKEQRRIERERIERELARQAVERATREARERAAADARARAEKAAVGKVHAEARARAERAAVMRAQAEARERAAHAAVEAKKRADREKAEREAKEKEAYEKAAAASVRASSSDPLFDPKFPKKQSGSVRTSAGSIPSTLKTSSANIVDDLSSVFGGGPSAVDFHGVEGETAERRRARLERDQRTQERAAKALAEKNKRDLDAQKEQAERDRIAETLDVEIKRWAAGKEGNLRALLSTMHYVLWPECGWQQVSLTDLITAAAVKKAYRKATLCIHPDKVQQKGANLQQKYVAEKAFDLLKEAWNKFNSEELF